MLGEVVAQAAFARRIDARGAVPVADDKNGRAGAGADKADHSRHQHNQRERQVAEKNRDKGKCCERDHCAAFQCPAADPVNRVQHDRQHRSLQPEKRGGDDRHLAERGVDQAQRHDGDDAGDDEQPAGDDRARPAMHQPADIGSELLRLGTGQQHAVAQRVEEPGLADPVLFVDDDAVHHRDLSGWAAEGQRGDAQPDAQRFAERDAMRR
jgi:hypothetical protein